MGSNNPLAGLLQLAELAKALQGGGVTAAPKGRAGRKGAYHDVEDGSTSIPMQHEGSTKTVAVKLQAGDNGRLFIVFDGPDKWRSIALDAYISIVEPSVVKAVAALASRAK